MTSRLSRRAGAPLLAVALLAGGTAVGTGVVPGGGSPSAQAPPVVAAASVGGGGTSVAPAVVEAEDVLTAPAATRTRTPLRNARRAILRRTNRARAAEGLDRLRLNKRMSRVAQRWTRRMAAEGSMSHNPVVGEQIPPGWSTWAENVAYGYAPRTVVRAWMRSPGHRANILRDVSHVGLGVARAPDGTRYFTQVFARY